MKFEFNWPNGFRGEDLNFENVDGWTDAGIITCILLAHP